MPSTAFKSQAPRVLPGAPAFTAGTLMAAALWQCSRHRSRLTRMAAPRQRQRFFSLNPSGGTFGSFAGPANGGNSEPSVQARSFATAVAGARPGLKVPTGELAFRASVLGNEGALSGHVYLDPNGRAAYLADGVQIVGRGVGHWAASGNAVAVELDVFQYAVASAVIPEKPHRFRGVWLANEGPLQGDWYYLPDENQAPRLVGTADAAASTMDLLPLAIMANSAHGPAARVPAAARDAAMAALDAQPDLRPVMSEHNLSSALAPFKVGDIPNVYYVPEWITPEQEQEFIKIADGDGGRAWEAMRTRHTQEWGAGDRCVCGRGLTRQPLPAAQQCLADALHHMGVFDAALYPLNSIRINSYQPGQGIHPHCDGPVYYPKIAILSLNAPTIFRFHQRTGTEDCMKWDAMNDVPGGHMSGSQTEMALWLEPRSLLIMSHDGFWHHRHGIEAVATERIPENLYNLEGAQAAGLNVGDIHHRKRRVSLTMRHLLPRCACQG